MAALKGSKTHENLKNAFAGESQANRRYLYFAKKADVEGYNDVAAVFRSPPRARPAMRTAISNSSKRWATRRPACRSASTELNLKAAIAGETHEYTDMYPGMARTARDEGFDEIADWFETLAKAEKSPCRPLPAGARHAGSRQGREKEFSRTLIYFSGPARGRAGHDLLGGNHARRQPRRSDPAPDRLARSGFLRRSKLDAEMRRVFDICHGCRRCFNLCDSFPRLFDLIDDGPSEELDSVDSKDFKPVKTPAPCATCAT